MEPGLPCSRVGGFNGPFTQLQGLYSVSDSLGDTGRAGPSRSTKCKIEDFGHILVYEDLSRRLE